MRWWRLAVVAATAITLAIAGVWFVKKEAVELPDSVSRVIARTPVSAWKKADCSVDLLESLARVSQGRRAECGTLRVPESSATRRMVQLSVVRLHASGVPGGEPILMLAGGPGDAFIPHLPKKLSYILPFATNRDFLFVDQRGTGLSKPSLDCAPSLRVKDQLARCFRGWSADLDPSSFNTDESASDLDVVLDELEIPKVVLFGVSYGTRLALRFASRFESRVTALILDSPVVASNDLLAQVGINAQKAMAELLAACQEQPDCASRYPAGLPQLVELTVELDAASRSIQPAGQEFVGNLSQFMYSPGALTFLPLLIAEAQGGKFATYFKLLGGFGDRTFSFGTHLSIQCAEHFAFTSRARIRVADAGMEPVFVKALSAESYADSCARWKVPPATLPREETRLSTPALVLSGRFDRVTPPAYARRVAASLSRSRLVSFGNLGHGAAFTPCGAEVVEEFLQTYRDKSSPPPRPCVTRAEQIKFALSAPDAKRMKELVNELRYRL